MLQIILTVIGILLATVGTVFIYDARVLTKKWFGFGDQNEASLGFKIIGFIIAITGALLVFFNI